MAIRPYRLALRATAASLLAAGSLFAAGVSPMAVHAAAASPFVTANGTQLDLNGRPWDFTGYDAYQATSVGNGFNCGGSYSDQQLNTLFAQMRSNSASTVVRTWFFQSYGGPANWSQYDRVLNAAAANGLRVIPALVNQWGDCEPWPNGVRPYRTLAWYQSGYTQTGDGYPLSFRDFAVAMAAHYANNPTIAFWQLVNEAEAKDSASGACENWPAATAMRGFADDVAGAMKAVDANHLINLGTMGGGQCGSQGAAYQYIHAGKIDMCEIHDYWTGALGGDQWNGAVSSINYCHGLNKPIFAGEAGLNASVQPDWSASGTVSASSLAQRATFFQQKMTAQFGLGTVGFLIWSKTLGASAGWDVAPGDPTEAVMRAKQNQLALAAGSLPDGHLITDGDPTPRASAPVAAAPLTTAASSIGTAHVSAQTIAVAQSSALAQTVVASNDATRATSAVPGVWAFHPPR